MIAQVGQAKLQGDDLDYLGIPGFHIAGAQVTKPPSVPLPPVFFLLSEYKF